MHYYSKEEIEYLRSISPGKSNKEITALFNKKFNLNLGEKAIGATRKRYNIKNGIDATFKKGSVPWNKGLKGIEIGGVETQFKKGHKPYNYLQVGTEMVKSDGYVWVKIEDPNVWKQKHRMLWEKHHGPIPENHVLIFLDQDRTNVKLDNLALISREKLINMIRHNLFFDKKELTGTGIVIADLYEKMIKLENKKEE